MIDKHIPTPSFGLGRGDRIDQLIEESDRHLKNLPNKLSADASPLKSDTNLQSNPSFQEMLQQLETFDAAVSSGSGAAPSKYDQAFFSALRTMLRECLFTKNPLMRKSHIERIYMWYQQKKSPSATTEATSKPPPSTTHVPRPQTTVISEQEREMRRLRYMHKLKSKDAAAEVPTELFPPPSTEAIAVRPEADGNGFSELEIPLPAEVKPACERVREYKMRNLRIAQMRRQGIPMVAIRAAEMAVKKQAEKRLQEAVGLSSITDVERAIRELWIKKRQEEEQDRRSEMEVKEAMQWWAKNRARIEEEISRRQESIRFASQTARIHANRNSFSQTAPASNNIEGNLSPASFKGEAQDDSILTDNEEEDIEIIEDLMHEKYTLPDKFLKIPRLKPPYDGLRTSTTDAGWSLSSAARPISARLAERAPGAAHNFGSPLPMDMSASRTRAQSAKARFATAVSNLPPPSISTYDQSSGVPRKTAQDPYDLHGFLSPHRSGGSRPASSYQGSYAPTPQDTPRGMSAATETLGSGVTRRAIQLAEVDRIKRAFAKSRIVCPLNVIERALTLPDDRSYAKCVDMLPRPGSHLLKDPIAQEKKAKQGKAGSGKKGKKKK